MERIKVNKTATTIPFCKTLFMVLLTFRILPIFLILVIKDKSVHNIVECDNTYRNWLEDRSVPVVAKNGNKCWGRLHLEFFKEKGLDSTIFEPGPACIGTNCLLLPV